MICVNLLRRHEHLWSNFTIAPVDLDVIDGENWFQSKLDLGPDDRILDELQARLWICENAVDVTRSRRESALLVGKTHFVAFVVVLDERCISASAIVAHVIQQHLLEEIRDCDLMIGRLPVDLVAKSLDHRRRKFYLAVFEQHTLSDLRCRLVR